MWDLISTSKHGCKEWGLERGKGVGGDGLEPGWSWVKMETDGEWEIDRGTDRN